MIGNTYPVAQPTDNAQFVQAQPIPGYPSQVNPYPTPVYAPPPPTVNIPPAPQLQLE